MTDTPLTEAELYHKAKSLPEWRAHLKAERIFMNSLDQYEQALSKKVLAQRVMNDALDLLEANQDYKDWEVVLLGTVGGQDD